MEALKKVEYKKGKSIARITGNTTVAFSAKRKTTAPEIILLWISFLNPYLLRKISPQGIGKNLEFTPDDPRDPRVFSGMNLRVLLQDITTT